MSKKLIALSIGLLASFVILAACGSSPSTLREFFDANASEFQELIAAAEEEMVALSAFGIDMSITIEIEGDHTIVYSYIYGPGTQFEDGIEALLAATIAEMADFQIEMATEMRRAMRIDTVYVTIRYLDSNGNILAEGTFAGQ